MFDMKIPSRSLATRSKGAPSISARPRSPRTPDPTPDPGIFQELIANRLRAMQKHIRSGRAKQVLLHAIVLANILSPEDPAASTVRDMVSQAQGLFMRGSRRLAEQRLQNAIDHWCTNSMQSLPVGSTHRYRGMAGAGLLANAAESSTLASVAPRLPKGRAARA